MLYYIAWLILQPWKFVLKCRGLTRIPWWRNFPFRKKSGLIIIANHIAWNDPWKIGINFPPWWLPHWWAKKELFNRDEAMKEFTENGWPEWIAWYIPFVVKNSSTIPVDKSNTFTKENKLAVISSLEILRKGGEIGIFPRGKIKESEYVDSYFVSMAKKTNSDILLVFVYEKGVKIIDLVTPESLEGDKDEIAKELMERIEINDKEVNKKSRQESLERRI